MYGTTKEAALKELVFEPVKHQYSMNGLWVPSVTQVIEPMLPYTGMPKSVRLAALQRGSIVHQLTEWLDAENDSLEPEVLRDVIQGGLDGYLKAWVEFKRAFTVEIIEREQRVYSKKYRYAGTLDRLARFHCSGYTNRLRLLEIKTGSLTPEYQLQTAAYLEAVNEERVTEQVLSRHVVLLRADGSFKTEEHTAGLDFQAFAAALAIQNWRKANHA